MEAIHALCHGTFPDEGVADPWPAFDPSRRDDPETIRVEVGGIPVSLHYPTGELENLCRDYFRNCPATSEPAQCYLSARQEDNGWAIRVNGCEFSTLQRKEQIGLGLMLAARALLYAEGDYDIAYHAAMVARGDSGIMLCTPRECGKSTLAAYLVTQGFELLADEPTLLHLGTSSVHPLCSPLSLKQGSWSVLRQQWPQLADAPIHVRSDGTRICFAHPAGEQRAARPRGLTQMVFPQYCATASPLAVLVSPLDTLRLLSEGGMLLAQRCGRDDFEAFLELVCRTPAYKLKYASLEQACTMLHEILCSVPCS